jgi:hypothetical protein
MHATVAHFGLAFAAAPPNGLTSPRTLSRRFMMQKVRSQAWPRTRRLPTAATVVALELLVGVRFQGLWTPLTGVLFTFPSRYLFTIGRQVVFSLTTWSSQIQTGFLVSRLTWGSRSAAVRFRLRGYHTLWPGFPACSTNRPRSYRGPATPSPLAWARFGLIVPVSLATTPGIEFSFFSSRY